MFPFVLHWMICTTLNILYCVELFVLSWMICITLNNLYKVELFFLPCKICTTSNDLYSVERFVLRWMIRSAMDDLYNVKSFGLRWIIEYRPFNACQVYLFEKYCKIFYANLWVEIFTDLRISRRNIFGSAPELVIKTCFWSL